MEKKRTFFLDFLRIIACFCVIINHTNSTIFRESTPDSRRWFFSLAYFFVSKIAVPLFLMISGYLLLGRTDSWKKAFGRFLRIGIVLVGCAVIYAAYNNLFVRDAFLWKNFLADVLLVPQRVPSNALWYLYAYLGILLMLPFLQKLAQAMEKKDYHVFFALAGFFSCTLPILQHYSDKFKVSSYFYIPLFGGYILMMLIGQYFARYGVKKTKWGFVVALFLFIAMVALNVTATYFEYLKSAKNYLFFDNRNFLPIMLEALCVFYMASFLKCGPRLGKTISYVGSCTFGIYLISDLVMKVLKPQYLALCEVIHPLPAVFVYELCIFVIGLAFTAVLKKIPLVKRCI